jgi:AraC-like DNA-binding protein
MNSGMVCSFYVFVYGIAPPSCYDRISVMPRQAVDHDRDTGVPDPEATGVTNSDATNSDALRGALEQLRLEGAVFLRAEYRESWAYESLPGAATAALLRPGTDRVILFHVVASGTCWIAVDGGPKFWADQGDVIVLPYGDQHSMGGVGLAESVSIASILQSPPWPQMPVIRHGQEGSQTDIVCGYLHSQDPLFDPALRVFPPVFVVRPPSGPAADWVRANIAYALEQTAVSPDGRAVLPTRLPELLLVEVLRLHLATAPAVERGWLAALRDPVLSSALALLHQSPERKWTVVELAKASAVSRSLLDERFRLVIGRSPIRYLTDWRMHLARELLVNSDVAVGGVARRVGYDAEEAFSRAFKRAYGSSPSMWRVSQARR